MPYRGEAAQVVHRLVGGLRSAMSYADAHSIAEFHANARFVRITHGRADRVAAARPQLTRSPAPRDTSGRVRSAERLHHPLRHVRHAPVRRQGPVPHRRHPDDLRLEAVRRPRAGRRRGGVAAAARRRLDAGRQDEPPRVRLRDVVAEPVVRHRRQPARPGARRGRLVRRLGGRDRDRRLRARARHRHGGVDPDPGVVVRRGRVQADARRRCRPTAASRWCRGSTTSGRSPATSRPAPTRSRCSRSGRGRGPPTRRRWPP